MPPDAISPEERKLIDDAVARQKPQAPKKHHLRNGKREDEIRRLAQEGKTTSEIAKQLGIGYRSVNYYETRYNIEITKRQYSKPGKREPRQGVVDRKRQERHAKKSAQVRDRRRFKTAPPPTGNVTMLLTADHPAVVDALPVHAHRIVDPANANTDKMRVLKSGEHNSKIGGDVLVGWLKGARIFTLTLPERITCPASCLHWRSCYGNMDLHASRWLPGPALEARIRDEVAALCEEHDKVLIRLHYLGDFYSVDYLAMWSDLLDRHLNLYCFGFTAHEPVSELGSMICIMRDQMHPKRFWIRHSGHHGEWGSTTLDFPTEKKTFGTAIVCPEQMDAIEGAERERHCGSCGVCWSTDAPVWFVEH